MGYSNDRLCEMFANLAFFDLVPVQVVFTPSQKCLQLGSAAPGSALAGAPPTWWGECPAARREAGDAELAAGAGLPPGPHDVVLLDREDARVHEHGVLLLLGHYHLEELGILVHLEEALPVGPEEAGRGGGHGRSARRCAGGLADDHGAAVDAQVVDGEVLVSRRALEELHVDVAHTLQRVVVLLEDVLGDRRVGLAGDRPAAVGALLGHVDVGDGHGHVHVDVDPLRARFGLARRPPRREVQVGDGVPGEEVLPGAYSRPRRRGGRGARRPTRRRRPPRRRPRRRSR